MTKFGLSAAATNPDTQDRAYMYARVTRECIKSGKRDPGQDADEATAIEVDRVSRIMTAEQ